MTIYKKRDPDELEFGQYGNTRIAGHNKNCKCSFCSINRSERNKTDKFLYRGNLGGNSLIWKTINGNRIMTRPNPHSFATKRMTQMRNIMNNDLLKLNENNPQDKRQVETLRINIAELDKTIKNNT